MANRWYRERKQDAYYRQAKQSGYRARSAYKLKQMQDRFRFLRDGDAVADLGCAPGGWSQVLVELVGRNGVVVGVDLQRTRAVDGAHFIQGDFTRKETRERLSDLLESKGRSHLDVVVSDMAPDMTGTYDLDQARSVHLCRLALDFALQHLKEGGHFLCKVFEGADFIEFREDVKRHFGRVFQFAPPASRKQSSEVYLFARSLSARHDDSEE